MKQPYLIELTSNKNKVVIYTLLLFWLYTTIAFWRWWLLPNHFVSGFWGTLISIFIGWNTLIPLHFIFFLSRMKKPNPEIPVPDLKVAMVVTRAPAEPFSVVKNTLLAMLAQSYPHDTWLADEDPTAEIHEWCTKNNVQISSRKGIPEYNMSTWPRREKSKEGNLCYFYDKYGYKAYDVVVQLDADHVPSSGYLLEMVRPFANPKVGYVSSPSICSANADKSWSARARLWAEAGLHGPQQLGHNSNFAPLCFGSHYAIRTKSLKEIGGLGPELAEDHSTTLMMNAFGWRGVHSVDAIAIGDGPATFTDAMIQEFQWSKSLTIIMLSVTPIYISKLNLKLKLQFLFSQMWYPLFSTLIFFSILIPAIALIINNPFVRIPFLEFTMRYFLTIFSMYLLISYLKRIKLLIPVDANMFSWETFLFQITRWPWVLFGCVSGTISVIRKKVFSFKVTPKGERSYEPIPFSILFPYFLIIILNLVVLILPIAPYLSAGNYLFIWVNALIYIISTLAIIVLHKREYANTK